MSDTIHLISNPKSGKGLDARLPEIGRLVCERHQFQLLHYEIKNREDFEDQVDRAVKAAIKDGGIVAAAGGDGTLRGVAQVAAGTGVRFAAIPIGTFNFFARDHQIPEDPEAAFELALSGKAEEVQLGMINGKVFVINASLGLYARAIQERAARTKRWGRNRLVVIISTIITLMTRRHYLNVQMVTEKDSQNIKTPMIFIGNNALQLRDLAMKVSLCMNRDLLAVVFMKPLRRFDILRMVFRGFFRTIEKEDRIESFCARELTIHTHHDHAHTVALDGEIFKMQSPLKVQTRARALNLIKPG